MLEYSHCVSVESNLIVISAMYYHTNLYVHSVIIAPAFLHSYLLDNQICPV